MAERRVVVAAGVGLHARPAALFVKAAGATGLPVTIAKAGTAAADARSILSVLSLDVRGGEEVVLTADGDDAEAALDSLALLLTAPDA
ncbi:MAG: phosphocarrier protein HPr [Frankiaceae bacterium]|jgi:phosphocarrier protein|nr:phosphocarrier protein HPr [Frankiaceae bacterium]MDQ1727459.1 phosphocarrier protein HPr [Frankiaceae bacterium]